MGLHETHEKKKKGKGVKEGPQCALPAAGHAAGGDVSSAVNEISNTSNSKPIALY